jgi:hypothetical protein
MAISRPFLLALLGALLLGATLFAVQSARENSTDEAAPVAEQSTPEQQAAAPAEPAPAANPQETMQSALNLGVVESSAFTARLSTSSGDDRVRVDLTGAFERGASNDVPEFELNAVVDGSGKKYEGGFTSLGDKAYFTQGDTGWRVPDELWSPVVESAAAQPQSLALPFDPQTLVREVKSEDSETVDGVETNHVSASVDPKAVVRQLVTAAGVTGGSLPAGRDAVKSAELDAWVGTDDRIVRRLTLGVDFGRQGELGFQLELSGVNKPQEIAAPAKVRDGMPSGAFGDLSESLAGGVSGAAGGQSVSLEALTSPNPERAARAVKAGNKVVIFFHNPKGLDDRAMKRVVRAVDGRTKALVLTDHVDAVERYGKMVEDLGVAQTPAVVLIDSTGEARLIEGYADTDTLAQAVADAR